MIIVYFKESLFHILGTIASCVGDFFQPSAFETLRIYADGQPYENPEGLATHQITTR